MQESVEAGRVRLTLVGELDLAAGPELELRLGELRCQGRPMLMDLSQPEFMDSTGLAVMVRAINASRTDHWAFKIDPKLSPQGRKLFSLTAIDQFAGIDGSGTSSA